jgi:hypothetical protein
VGIAPTENPNLAQRTPWRGGTDRKAQDLLESSEYPDMIFALSPKPIDSILALFG